ncbi:MAG: XRE family transcriptional regulator [Bacilli bacterium]|nr:XRE family transcriptional regulator [Bacilli bacterium]
MEQLEKFLIEAKKQTYANGNVDKVNSSRVGSNDYHYERDGMVYHDTFFGGVKFIGEEVVYINSDVPVWGMNYYGVTIDSSLSEEAMDKALRPALMRVGEDKNVLPLRGPSKFENEEYIYTFKCEGTIDNFSGVEEIYKNDKLIFKLQCHGGLIK